MKYLIKARFEVDGRVDRHDVIGAIFGQTEGLLGSEFNLEELQNKDKIGRIHVELKYQGTKTVGTIQVPSNLDRVETSILAAMLETVDRIGPYSARIVVEEIKDLREEKLRKIIERARELLRQMKSKEPDIKEVIREVLQKETKQPQLVEYGPDKLPAGPDVEKSDTLIIVEGRADVINLLKYGYTNVIALGGAREKVPKTIVDLAKKKEKVIAFVDGDRGGDLVLKTLLTQAKVDYVARAPKGMEVEKLTGREIAKALSQLVPVEEVKKKLGLAPEAKPEVKVEKPPTPPKPEAKPAPPAPAAPAHVEAKPPQPPAAPPAVKPAPPQQAPSIQPQPKQEVLSIPKSVVEEIPKLKGTLEGVLYDSSWREVERVKVKDLYTRLQQMEPGKVHAIVFDGIITQRLLDLAAEKKVALLIGAKVGSKLAGRPAPVRFMTFTDLAG